MDWSATKGLYQGAGIIHIFSISGIVQGKREICTEGWKPHNYAVFRLSFHFWHMIFRSIFTEFRMRRDKVMSKFIENEMNRKQVRKGWLETVPLFYII